MDNQNMIDSMANNADYDDYDDDPDANDVENVADVDVDALERLLELKQKETIMKTIWMVEKWDRINAIEKNEIQKNRNQKKFNWMKANSSNPDAELAVGKINRIVVESLFEWVIQKTMRGRRKLY